MQLHTTEDLTMATIQKLRGYWQEQVRKYVMKPYCKSFPTKLDAIQSTLERDGSLSEDRTVSDIRYI